MEYAVILCSLVTALGCSSCAWSLTVGFLGKGEAESALQPLRDLLKESYNSLAADEFRDDGAFENILAADVAAEKKMEKAPVV